MLTIFVLEWCNDDACLPTGLAEHWKGSKTKLPFWTLTPRHLSRTFARSLLSPLLHPLTPPLTFLACKATTNPSSRTPCSPPPNTIPLFSLPRPPIPQKPVPQQYTAHRNGDSRGGTFMHFTSSPSRVLSLIEGGSPCSVPIC